MVEPPRAPAAPAKSRRRVIPLEHAGRSGYALTVATLTSLVSEFVALMQAGQPLQAMQRFYADDVVVFENRELARAGRDACLTFEAAQLSRNPGPLTFKLVSSACDEQTGQVFLEYVLRFTASNGRPMRLEEVAVQTWSRGKIVQERFYYEGLVDEGDEGEADKPPLAKR